MMPVMINSVPVDCINHAAIIYHVPATIILSVIKKENGKNGDAIKNKNGTYDYGVLQINSIWLPKLAAYGYTRHDIQYDACKNIMVGTWIIAQNMASSQSVWTGVANYHSRTPVHHHAYRASIATHYNKLMSVISI